MSHYTVLVIGNNPTDQLSPFQENNMEDCPKEYLSFTDTEQECRIQFENETSTRVLLPNGEHVYPHSEIAKKLKDKSPELYKEIEVPLNEIYNDFNSYMKDYHGYGIDKETGKYGYWSNPKSKWDWFVLGGRWKGVFKLKEGATGLSGRSGVFGNESRDGYVDMAKKCDIDWEGMLADNIEDGEKAKRFWELYVEDIVAENDEERKIKSSGYYKKEYYLDVYQTKEFYVKSAVEFSTWAVLKDSEWNEPGEMGWWGSDSAESSDKREWKKSYFDRWIEPLSDDTLLSVYDCHI
jgi:hypothetical protein